MKKFVILGMFLMFASSVHAAVMYDFLGTNKKSKLAFANQVISEFLTPEELKTKERVKELIQSDGDNISIVDVISDSKNMQNSKLRYDLKYFRFNKPTTHEELLNSCNSCGYRALNQDFRERGMIQSDEDYKFEIVSEYPKDIIYIAEGKAKNSDFHIVHIVRNVRVGKWAFAADYALLEPTINADKKQEIVERLKNLSSANNWISINRQKGL